MKYKEILSKIPENVKLVVVSKTQPINSIHEVYQQGQRIFGENKVQELCIKQQELPNDIEWHFVGHLQTNKVKCIAPFVSLIHAVDSLKLIEEIQKHAQKNKRTIDCLLQFHIAQETSKFGLNYERCLDILKNIDEYKNVRIRGVMGMATLANDSKQISKEFGSLKKIFDELKQQFFLENIYFDTLSMGMSGDFKLAIAQGSTMVRIGTYIFRD